MLQRGLICLEVAGTCMKTQNIHENVLVVGQNSNSLEILDMRMLAKTIMLVSVYIQVYTCMYLDILCLLVDILGYTLHTSMYI